MNFAFMKGNLYLDFKFSRQRFIVSFRCMAQRSPVERYKYFGGIYWPNFKADLNQTMQYQNPGDHNMNFCSALQGFQMENTVRSSGHSNGTACLRMQAEQAKVSNSHELAAQRVTWYFLC